jgi:mRNA interferase MazF
MELIQYAIVLVRLDPTLGSEIQKTRPCVILSPNEMNRYLNTIIIAPMTTTLRQYPTRVAVRFDKKNGMIAIDQIRTIDKARILSSLGQLSARQIEACKAVLKETFVD